MEPCLFRHGKYIEVAAGVLVVGLQWSHVFSDMVSAHPGEIPPDLHRFNGAMSFQTW